MNLKKMITVLSPSFALTSIVALSSALANISEAFPDVSISAIQSLTALPSLIAIPVILFSGILSSRITKKRIVACSIGLMFLGGIMPLIFHQEYYQLLLASVIFGLGFGGISPLTTALIHEHYSPEEQPTILCFQSAVVGIGGVIFSSLGGWLAAKCWWHVYYAFLLFIPILILVSMLPKGSITPRISNAGGKTGRVLNINLLFYIGQAILFCLFLYIFTNNLALFVSQQNLGGSELTGHILSVKSALGIISGILGGRILKKLGKFSLPTILLTCGISQLAVFFFGGVSALFFAAALEGFFFSIRMPAGYLKSTQSVAPAAATLAISIYCSSSQVGQFLSPHVINAVSDMFSLTIHQKFLWVASVWSGGRHISGLELIPKKVNRSS
ncbi:MAG: MFS transporter [Lachnospiraceae bacterium]